MSEIKGFDLSRLTQDENFGFHSFAIVEFEKCKDSKITEFVNNYKVKYNVFDGSMKVSGGENVLSYDAVSYTHLDVYKRQLYDNAIAYAGEGIHITVSCYKEDPKFYYFSFSDNGVGVSEEHVNRIFERFYRVDKGRSRKVGGTGLGLSIVKNGVNFHKGQISAKSGLGKGMTFFFTLKKKI